MPSPLVAVRQLAVPFNNEVFRIELGAPRDASGIVFLLRDNGNVVGENALGFALRDCGFATAVCSLLTPAEREKAKAHRRNPIDAEVLARRLMTAVDVVCDEEDLGSIPAGIAVSGTASTAALRVAVLRPLAFDAVTCRHANLSCACLLEYERSATLFLAVAGDLARIRPMTRAFQQLLCPKRFEILPSGAPAFDDEHTFALASEATCTWMKKHLGRTSTAVRPPAHAGTPSMATQRPLTHRRTSKPRSIE